MTVPAADHPEGPEEDLRRAESPPSDSPTLGRAATLAVGSFNTAASEQEGKPD